MGMSGQVSCIQIYVATSHRIFSQTIPASLWACGGAGGWVVDTDRDAFVEAPGGPFLGWFRDASRGFYPEVVGSEDGKPALFALPLQVGRGRDGAATPGDSPDDVLLGYMRAHEADAVAIVQWEGHRHVTRTRLGRVPALVSEVPFVPT